MRFDRNRFMMSRCFWHGVVLGLNLVMVVGTEREYSLRRGKNLVTMLAIQDESKAFIRKRLRSWEYDQDVERELKVVSSMIPSSITRQTPTKVPTFEPTMSSPILTPSNTPSNSSSNLPSFDLSFNPSFEPSSTPSHQPSVLSTLSPAPTLAPSFYPSFLLSGHPSISKTSFPSFSPTNEPSISPTISINPSLHNESREINIFKQNFYRNSDQRFLNSTQKEFFADTISSLVTLYIMDDEKVQYLETTCNVLSQTSSSRRLRTHGLPRTLTESKLTLTYSIEYRSTRQNVTLYAERYRDFMRSPSNQLYLMDILNNEGDFELTFVHQAGIVINDGPEPSAAPSSNQDSSTFPPPPGIGQSTTDDEKSNNDSETDIVIGITIAAAASLSFVSGVMYCCHKKIFDDESSHNKGPPTAESESGSNKGSPEHRNIRPKEQTHVMMDNREPRNGDDCGADGASSSGSIVYVSPFEHLADLPISNSIVSNPSLLSPAISYSTNELHAIDDFDSFRDTHLEKLRSEVEKIVVDIDGMMSQALTNALIEDDDQEDDDLSFFSNQLWDNDNFGTGSEIEIEASILCDTYEFLKRNIESEIMMEVKRSFMQDMLNKMVARVRYEIIDPEPAAAIIHGCAGMLGFQLSGLVPMKTIMITGLRKKANSGDLQNVFSEFGEIEAVIVLDSRGFGLVRYKSPRSVTNVLTRYRLGEIVVHDVAVRVKVVGQTYSQKYHTSNHDNSHQRILSYNTTFSSGAIPPSAVLSSSLHGSFIFVPSSNQHTYRSVGSYNTGSNSDTDGSIQDNSYKMRNAHKRVPKHTRVHSEPFEIQKVDLTEI